MGRNLQRIQRIEVNVGCSAPKGYFEDVLPHEVVAELNENGPIPCEGTGIFLGCRECRFCDFYRVENGGTINELRRH